MALQLVLAPAVPDQWRTRTGGTARLATMTMTRMITAGMPALRAAMCIAACCLCTAAATGCLKGGHQNGQTCLPNWEPTWALNRSTVLYTCNDSGYHDVERAKKWGVVVYDWYISLRHSDPSLFCPSLLACSNDTSNTSTLPLLLSLLLKPSFWKPCRVKARPTVEPPDHSCRGRVGGQGRTLPSSTPVNPGIHYRRASGRTSE